MEGGLVEGQTNVGLAADVSEELIELLLLIDQSASPVGSRQLVRQLEKQGKTWSEATMARRLRELDDRGLTKKVGAKGRESTTSGRALALSVRRGERSAAQFREASTIRTADDVLHLLRARRAIEPEGARGATEALIGQNDPAVRRLVEQHRSAVRDGGPVPRKLAMAFHREIARLSVNPIVRVMLDIVLSEDMDPVEDILDIVLEAHHHAAESVDEHERILAAMTAGDADHAADLMHEHLDRLVNEVLTFIDNNGAWIINRMIDASSRA